MLLFDHWPKAGGTTIRHYLQQCFDEDRFFSVSEHRPGDMKKDLTELPKHERDRLGCVAAHYARPDLMTENARIVTILREPVSRFVSLYYFSQVTPGMGRLHLDACDMDVVEFVEAYEDHGMVPYFQTMAQLHQYEVVGDQSKMSFFAKGLRAHFSLRAKYTHMRLNENRKKGPDPVGSELRKLQDLCGDDTKLYEAWKAEAGPSLLMVRNCNCG